ncbi:MAG TPA: selenocysteine-specific translation elongation factor, partial [Actinomycetota bacterium]|nr:selenocysteine-specific translation elongation factor [Actinomycetota bacterium]
MEAAGPSGAGPAGAAGPAGPAAVEGPPLQAAQGAPLQVVATAGHVDHGKSALILRLTGMDPDRLAEEKRRGLTIDLGFAWTTLPSGREVGFVDVPGHERFVRNMLAGVGPVRLVLFVVAADEGWKPQSEEHLQIVDVLGVEGAVVALTKRDLVDGATLEERTAEVRARLEGTRLEGAPVVPCSAVTGEGLEELVKALDEMLLAAPPPEDRGRPRQFLDRVFTIKGAGTVVTGTLTGGPLRVGQEVEVLPSGHRARIRGLQTHRRTIEVARPVSRVAANLAGTPKEELERGDVLTLTGQWRATSAFEGWLRPVRGLGHHLTARGAYKLYAGSAERDARLRLYGTAELRSGEEAFVRVSLSRPVVLDVHDRFVLREAGRRETVAGGIVLDPDPPSRPGPDPAARLRARLRADRGEVARLLVRERGVVAAADVFILCGAEAAEAVRRGAVALGGFVADPEAVERAAGELVRALAAHHAAHPLLPGLEVGEARALVLRALAPSGAGAGGAGG